MTAGDRLRALRLPRPGFDTAQAHAPLRVLSLTGGGYRGLFSARLLVSLCEQARRDGALNGAFDVFAGTSIGGLMACGLAVGMPARRVLDAIDAQGPKLFPRKRQRTLRRALFGTLYDTDHLARAVDESLGRFAQVKLKNVPVGLLVPAVDWARGCAEVFVSGAFGKARASDATLRDVCLASAAAPTFFKPHVVDGAALLDGGLAANNPDVLVLLEVAKRWPQALARTQMLSIGSAGADSARTLDDAEKTGLAWASALPVFMMTVQERSAAAQAQRLLGTRYLRLDHVPQPGQAAFENLDLADDAARSALLAAATLSAESAYRTQRAFIDRILADRR